MKHGHRFVLKVKVPIDNPVVQSVESIWKSANWHEREAYEIPLTLGSDAHDPNDVGKGFEVAYQLIQIYGGGKVSVFEGRERKEIKL